MKVFDRTLSNSRVRLKGPILKVVYHKTVYTYNIILEIFIFLLDPYSFQLELQP